MPDGGRDSAVASYVQRRDGGYWVADTRISLDSVVHAYKRGAAPESIQRAFPLLSLEEVFGALTFYLAHTAEIEAYLDRAEAAFASQARDLNAAAQTRAPHLLDRVRAARAMRDTSSRP